MTALFSLNLVFKKLLYIFATIGIEQGASNHLTILPKSFMRKRLIEKIWETKLHNLNAPLDYELIPTLIEADGIITDLSTFTGEMEEDRLYVFAVKKDGGKTMEYDIYYNRLQIHLHYSNMEKYIEAFIAKESNSWTVSAGDTASSKTEKFRIYVWEKKLFMTDTFLSDNLYISGSWNKYVYKQLSTVLTIFEHRQESFDYDKIYNEKLISYGSKSSE